MQIEGSTALVTGANRGLGRRFAEELVARGAKVYAGARNPESVDLAGVTPIALDITDPDSVEAAAAATGDVSLLINNAGSATGAGLLEGSLADIKLELDTHFFGTLAVTPGVPAAAGGGGWQRGGWQRGPQRAVRAVLGQLPGRRGLLRGQGGGVVADQRAAAGAGRAGHAGHGAARRIHGHRHGPARHLAQDDPAMVAKLAPDGVAAGLPEVLADELSQRVQRGLAGGVAALYPALS